MMKERYYEDRNALFKQLHGRILDIGCNWGEIHSYLEKKQGRIVYGMDIILTNYRDNVVRADAHYIPFKKETFDSIFAGEIIEHLENPAQFLREVERVLKRGGASNTDDTKHSQFELPKRHIAEERDAFGLLRAYLRMGLKAFAKLFPETQFAIGDRGVRVCRWWWA